MVQVWLVMVAALLGSSCIEAHCDLACPHQALQSKVDVTADALSGSTVTFCVNNLCHSGVLPPVNATGRTDATLDNCTSVMLLPEAEGGFDMVLGPCDATSIVAGDLLALRIADPAGHLFLTHSKTVAYADEEVCGSTCHVLQLIF